MQSTVRPARFTTAAAPSRWCAQSPTVRPSHLACVHGPRVSGTFREGKYVGASGVRGSGSNGQASMQQPLEQYCQLLWSRNRHLNLTRHTDYEKFVSRDLLDTMELSSLIPPSMEVLDVGSGGGVPGIVLSIIRPDLEITLAESVTKKAEALN